MKWEGKHTVTSMKPHMDRSPTYNGLLPGSLRRSFTTLLSLPQ